MKKMMLSVLMTVIITFPAWAQQKIQKDESLGVILSLGTPGMGQIYAGKTWRGIGIMAAEAVCAGVVIGITENRTKIKIEDVNGNIHNLWTKNNKKLSGGEIAAVATAGVAGLGIYIWQLCDAKRCVQRYNRERGFDVGFGAIPNGAACFSLNVKF